MEFVRVLRWNTSKTYFKTIHSNFVQKNGFYDCSRNFSIKLQVTTQTSMNLQNTSHLVHRNPFQYNLGHLKIGVQNNFFSQEKNDNQKQTPKDHENASQEKPRESEESIRQESASQSDQKTASQSASPLEKETQKEDKITKNIKKPVVVSSIGICFLFHTQDCLLSI